MDKESIKSAERFAVVKLADGKNLAILDIEIHTGVQIARNRAGLHELVRKFSLSRYFGFLSQRRYDPN